MTVTVKTVIKRPETIDFSGDEPRLNEDVVLKMVRRHLAVVSKIHLFFTGAKIRIIRCYDYSNLDNAEKKDQLLGVYNKHEYGQQIIEKAVIKDSLEAIREWYG